MGQGVRPLVPFYAMDPHTETVRVEVDYSRPEVVSWRLLEGEKIEIVFSKPLDKVSAEEVDNYTLYRNSVKDTNEITYAVSNVSLGGDNKTVTVEFYINTLKPGNRYVLNVKNVTDNTTLKNVMIEEDLEFVYGIAEGLEVLSAYTTEGRDNATAKITLVFNNQLVREEAENLRNYELKPADNNWWAVEDLSKDARIELYDDGYKVDIFLPGNGKVVEKIRLSRAIRDLNGNRPKDTEIELNKSRTELVTAELTKDDEIVLTFNQNVYVKNPGEAKNQITLTGGNITDVTDKNGKVVLTISGTPTKVKVAVGDYIRNYYDSFGIKAGEVEVKDVRAAKVKAVTVERTTEDGAGNVLVNIKVEFTRGLNPNTVGGLKVKVNNGSPVALTHVQSSDYTKFEAKDVKLPIDTTQVRVEVLTSGVKDLQGNSVEGYVKNDVQITDDPNYGTVAGIRNNLTAAALTFDSINGDTSQNPEILVPTPTQQQESYEFTNIAYDDTERTNGKAVIDEITGTKVTITRDTNNQFTFKLTVEISLNDAKAYKVFKVIVPTGAGQVTIALQ